MMHNFAEVKSLVQRDIESLRENNTTVISAPAVADRIVRSLRIDGADADLSRAAAYIGIAQVARECLRGALREQFSSDPSQEQLDLPETALLNSGYSVMRSSEPVYVPIDQLTRDDVEFVCAGFEKRAEHYLAHSRALRSYHARRTASAA